MGNCNGQRELRACLTDDTSDVFLCDKCELLKEGNNTGRKHTLVRFQDKQAVMSRRLEAVEEKPNVVVKGHDALNRCIDGLEEFLQKFFAASSAEVRGGPDMLVQLHVVLYDAGDSAQYECLQPHIVSDSPQEYPERRAPGAV